MFMCDSCGLFWLANFSLEDTHYETLDFSLGKTGKMNTRYANAIERIETLRKYADLNNVCDIGCGEGVFLKTLGDLGYKNLIGLEPGREAQDFAVRNKLDIREGTIENVDKSFFSSNGIHTVSMFHVIEHLKDPSVAVEMIGSSLQRGDQLIIETPDADSYLLRKTDYRHELIYPEHLYYFNKKNLHTLLEKSGFRVIASGNRDFNEKNMSIKESLARLGLMKTAGLEKKTPLGVEVGIKTSAPDTGGGIARLLTRSLLAKAVRILGRGNYQWVVAEKI